MHAAILAIGSELLHSGRHDTNGDWMAERLERRGVRVKMRACVEDDVDAIASWTRGALERCDLVLMSGGLGPTEDDRTRDAAALALGVELVRDPDVVARIRRRFEEHGRPFREHQSKQADRPRGADWLANPMGTAPGFVARFRSSVLIALPGVPAELREMFEANLPTIVPEERRRGRCRKTVKIAGRLESSVDRQIRDLYDLPDVSLTILAGLRGLELHVVTEDRDPDEAERRLDRVIGELCARLGRDVFGFDDETLASVVGRALVARGWTLATAESCTAGMLAAELTSVSGSSKWFRGGLVVYDDRLKTELARVDDATLAAHGAVSPEVAIELARGARRVGRADVGVGITGIAGPGGGTDTKPVGTVHVAIADPCGEEARAFRFPGDRHAVRARTVSWALDSVRRRSFEP